jgi:hypothetical protein
MAIPSQVQKWEGVETLRHPSTTLCYDEEKVQTTNTQVVVKTIVVS